ncbi:M protein- serotype 2.1 precursor [Apiospora saccharicola]|uniref:M protein- serotype 2.1 n=1 Tax=Apiospora saccharicola TaxID=335842 RepID=A0ABR1U465_9PEZI
MSAATKKPPSAGIGRLPDSSPSVDRATARSTPRSSTPSTSAVAASLNSTPSRTRSTRSGTPVSARAAAAHRQSSSLSISSNEVDEAARAETVALIDDLKARLEKADSTSEQFRKQAEVLQSRLDETLKEQAKFEERVHESEEQIEALRNEKRESARQMREMETIYEAERSSMLKEKEEMSNREEEMQSVINRLKDTINQKNVDDEYRPSRQLQRSDSRNNSKLLLQKDKLIESLRLELAEAQIKLVESENQGGGRLHEVERLLMEARMANARLMEDNESYQLLLQEKTLHGDFGKGDFSYMGVSANQDALSALEGRSSTGGEAPAESNATTLGASLADELGDAADDLAVSTVDDGEHQRRLEGEIRAMKDQNKALTLYINKIIERLLQHQEFEHILDQSSDPKAGANVNKELPTTPSDAGGFLARAKTAMNGNTPPCCSRHTAPSIPIGLARSASSRRVPGRPMSEQIIGAAGIVNAMYKGPDGPMSPTLSAGRNSAQFFSGAGTPRAASTGGAPTAGNFPGMRSETSSVSGESAGGDASNTSVSQSPPRTIGSGHSEGKGSHATFAGNKPRPLRLVQENAPPPEANKRASWFGWAQSALQNRAASEGGTSESIKE